MNKHDVLKLISDQLQYAAEDYDGPNGPYPDWVEHVVVNDLLDPEGCMHVSVGDRHFHIVIDEIDLEGNELDEDRDVMGEHFGRNE